MIAILMAAVVVTDINDRPTLLVGQEGQAGYVAALDNKLATAPYLTAVENIVMPGCATLTYAPTGFRELGLKDQLPDTFYKTMAQEPAVMESVLVSGCGKTLAVNVLSYRSFDNKLNFFCKIFREYESWYWSTGLCI